MKSRRRSGADEGVVLDTRNLTPPIVIVPVDQWNAATEKALQFAMTLSPDVEAVHVTCDADEDKPTWNVGGRSAGGTRVPKLVTLPSPFRLVVHPIVDYVLKVEKRESGADGRGGDCDDGGAALVSLFSAQSARTDADGAAAAEWG